MIVGNEFTEALKALESGGVEPSLSPDGAVCIETGGVELTFVVPETDPGTVFCRAAVGTLSGLDADGASLALLSDNHLWQATNGATLSLRGDDVFLTDRRDAVYFASAEVLVGYCADFASTVRLVRERLETFRPDGREVR